MPRPPRFFSQRATFAVIAGLGLYFAAGLASAQTGAGPTPAPITVTRMFISASPMVKAVMVALVLASVLSWATLLVKLSELRQSSRSMRNAHDRLQLAPSLLKVTSLDDRSVLLLVDAAKREAERSQPLAAAGLHDGMLERLAAGLQRVEDERSRHAGRGLPILASIGAISPFVGLFGTVWGIMHSFVDIAQTSTTNLAVVAPGIAEALLATAFGLGAAIPATLMYNVLGRRVTEWRAQLGDCASEVLSLASRDADHQRLAAAEGQSGAGHGAATHRETPRVVALSSS